ncbi:MAG: BamA/TamA family outer membrane protein [Bacteroidota bacterium]|jgi:outer membrane protein assembly factor BamA
MLVFAQKGVSVSLVSIDASERSASFWKGIHKTYQEKDSASVLLLAKQIQLKAINKGFIASQYRVIQKDSANYQIQVQLGDQYRWIQLKANPLYRDILFKAGYKSIDYANQPIKFSKLENIFEKALQICDNTGHPFADIRLDSINIDGPKVSGFIRLELNQFIKIDSIIIKGNSRISPYFINNYLGIKAGRAYQESKIVAIESRLKELPYIKSIKPYEFTFTPATSKLVLYLDNKKANQFDGVLGFLPNERTGKIEFTGQAHLKLQNALNRGELIDIDWRRLQLNSRDIKAKVTYPYLINTPLGLDLNFKLFQRDTIFIDVTQHAGLQYLLSGNNFFKFFVNNRSLSLVSTTGLDMLSTLPEYADVKTLTYGLGVKYEQTDYRFNPRKGYRVSANVATGNKKIIKNPKINAALYEDVNLKSVLYNGDLQADLFIPVMRQSTINIGLKAAGMQTEEVFLNEAYRIGGNNSVRGFDEESIYATSYGIANLEYRFLFEQNSFLFLFGNAAWYELDTEKSYLKDTPYGFGAGVSFQTKAGIFSISYALGKQFDNPLLLRAAKVHFGIVSVF